MAAETAERRTAAADRKARRDAKKVRTEVCNDDPVRMKICFEKLARHPESMPSMSGAADVAHESVASRMCASAKAYLAACGKSSADAGYKTAAIAAIVGDDLTDGEIATSLGIDARMVAKARAARKEVMDPRRSGKAGLKFRVLKARAQRFKYTPVTAPDVVAFWDRHTRVSTWTRHANVRRPSWAKEGPRQHVLHLQDVSDWEMYNKFKLVTPGFLLGRRRVGFKVFRRLRPWYIRRLTERMRRTCCCEAHERAAKIFRSFHQLGCRLEKEHGDHTARGNRSRAAAAGVARSTALAAGGDITARAAQERAEIEENMNAIRPLLQSGGVLRVFVEKVMCNPRASSSLSPEAPRFTPLSCLLGDCTKCGDVLVQPILDGILKLCKDDEEVSYVDYVHVEVGKRKKKSKVLTQVRQTVTVAEFLEKVKNMLFGPMMKRKDAHYHRGPENRSYRKGHVWHSFETVFQNWQMLQDLKDFPSGEGRFTSDFSQNLVLEHDDQPQSGYWNPTQVTLYTAVFYYKDPAIDEIVKVYYHVLSNDLDHDEFAVRAFHNAIMADLTNRGVVVVRWVWWSDGAGQHFKSAPCFRDIHNHSFLAPRDGVPVNRAYTASGHGKGEHDGAATYVKSSVKKHLLTVEGKFGSKGIRSAQECFEWCRDYLPAVAANQQQWSSKKGAVKLYDRRFVYVDTSDVERPDKITWEVDDRVGALHELMFRPGKEEMHGRDLTCVCAHCRAGKYVKCCWGAWVDLPRHVRMKTAAKGKQSQAALREIECRCRSVNESRDCVHCRRKKIGV